MRIKLLVLLSVFLIYNSYALSSNASTIVTYNQPVVEVAELQQAGSLSNPWIYNLTQDFTYVTKMIWALDFSATTLDYNYFDGNSSALTNGINVFYNGQSLVGNDTIKANHEFAHFAYNIEVLVDERNPKDYVLVVQWLLTSFIPDGLLITPTKTIQIYIQDDLTALTSISEFSCTFKGYKILNEAVNDNLNTQQQDILTQLENMWSNGGLGTQITILLVIVTGTLFIWVIFKKLRQSL